MKTTSLTTYAHINPPAPNIDPSSNELFSFIPMASVSEDGQLTNQETRTIQNIGRGYKYFERDDVLIAKISPCMENGKATLLRSLKHNRGFGSTEFHVLRPKPSVFPRFLFYLVWNQRFRSHAAKNMTGSAGQKRVPSTYIRSFTVPVIETEKEQQHIVHILDKIYNIIQKRKKSINLTNQLIRSSFLDMFGDPVINPKTWKREKIGQIAKITTGNTPSRATLDYYGENIEWIKSDNINRPSHYLSKAQESLSAKGRLVAREVPKGSILMTCIAGSINCIGNVSIADRDVAFNQQINALTPAPNIDYRFLYVLLLEAKKLIQNASTNSMKALVNKKRLSQIEIPIPPIELQTQFGNLFERFIKIYQHQEAALVELEILFQATSNQFLGLPE